MRRKEIFREKERGMVKTGKRETGEKKKNRERK